MSKTYPNLGFGNKFCKLTVKGEQDWNFTEIQAVHVVALPSL